MEELLWSRDYGKRRYLKKGQILICACGRKFYVHPSEDRKFCSRGCAGKGHKPKPKTGRYFGCNNCGKQIWVRPHNFHRKKHFCSRGCFVKYDFGGTLALVCKKCRRPYNTFRSHVRLRGSNFCSKKCMWKFRKGRNNNSWKGGRALKKSLWIIFSKYIRLRDKGRCFTCGVQRDWREMDAGHYIPKTAGLSVYFDEKNVHCQCTRCNRWLHGNLSQYALELRRKYGDTILEELEWKRRQVTKFSSSQYQDLINHYKNLVGKLMKELQLNEKPKKSRPQCPEHRLKFCTLCYPVKKKKPKRSDNDNS